MGCAAAGVTVCGTRGSGGGSGGATAELTWVLILAVTPHIVEEDAVEDSAAFAAGQPVRIVTEG